MHCEANTLNGQFAFRAIYEDGSTASETDYLWDELPADKAIQRLEIVDADGLTLAELQHCERYVFANEAISVSNFVPTPDGDLQGTVMGEPILSAKIIIGVAGEQAVRCRVDLLAEGGAKLEQAHCEASKLRFIPSAYRPGLGIKLLEN